MFFTGKQFVYSHKMCVYSLNTYRAGPIMTKKLYTRNDYAFITCVGLELCNEQYFNTVIVFDYWLQIPLHFGDTVKTNSCKNHCNLKQICYNYVVSLHNFIVFFVLKTLHR